MKRLLDLVVVVLGVAIAGGCGGGAANKTGAGGNGGSGTGAGGIVGGGAGTHGDAAVSGGSCSFTACGGFIVGTWHIASLCGTLSSLNCSRVPIDQLMTQLTYTFGSDGKFTYGLSGTTTETFHYPVACLSSADAGTGAAEVCANYQSAIQSALVRTDGGTAVVQITSYTCPLEGTETCACTEVISYPSPQTETGTYTASGTQLTIAITGASFDAGVGDGGAEGPVDYCVSGNTLALHFVGGTQNSDIVMTLTR